MSTQQIKSDTASILANLQQKIFKYLSPSYQTCDIFDKSKAIIKNHQQIIQSNKDFIKKNQHQEFKKNQEQNQNNQFDQLLHRRRKCQTKLYQMLFDHQIQQSLRIGFSPTQMPQQKNSFRPSCNDFMSVSSFKQVRSQAVLPTIQQPNFLQIQKQLQKMQKKLQKISKKVNKSNTSKKNMSSKHIKDSKISEYIKVNKNNQKPQLKLKSIKSSEAHKCRSCSSSKKQSLLQINNRLSNVNSNTKQNMKNKMSRQNSQQNLCIKNKKKCNKSNDQTSLFAKLSPKKIKNQQRTDLKESKLKKVGLGRFIQNSKKTLESNKNNAKTIKSKIQNKIINQNENNLHKSQNRIKVNLLKCQSQQLL